MKGYSNLTLEEKLDQLEVEIELYKPKTPWEQANHRTLKNLHRRRQALLKAIKRSESEQRFEMIIKK